MRFRSPAPSFAWNPSKARGQAKDVLHRLGEGGPLSFQVPSYGWPAIFIGSVAHQQSARMTCERQRGQHSPLPPFFRGHSSVRRAGASHAPVRRRDSFCPHHLSLWCSPVNTSASHAEDHRSEAGQGRQFLPPKHLERCTPLVGNQLGAITGGGSSFGEWLSGNSRPHRSRICEPWRFTVN